MFSKRMSSNAAKLVNRKRLKGVDVPLRWRQDAIPPTGVTKPAGQTPSEQMPVELHHYDTNGVLLGSGFHCDSPEHGSDRVGELQFWLALAEVTPAMGPMRFVNRSHREFLGTVFNQDKDDLGGQAGHRASGNILDQYPLLPQVLGMSAPEETHYQLGDCTVHHGYCAHGSINNTTDRDRCSYLFSYSPADTRYMEAAGGANNGSPRVRVLDDRTSPVVYRPASLASAVVSAPLPVVSVPSTSRALSEEDMCALVREVTEEEVAHYKECGWVMMRALVAPSLVAEMLGVLRSMDADAGGAGTFPTRNVASRMAMRGIEPFRSFIFSKRVTSNAAKLNDIARLKGVDVPLRYRLDVATKKPAGQPASKEPHGTIGFCPSRFLSVVGMASDMIFEMIEPANGIWCCQPFLCAAAQGMGLAGTRTRRSMAEIGLAS